jgi:hypothetical protein
MSVNAHRSNACIHSLLQLDKLHILLIQEPWHYTIAMTHSDTDPEGTPQRGLPLNNKWNAHLPHLKPDNTLKVAIYTKKTLIEGQNDTIQHQHPLANHNLMVINILDKGTVALCIINIYHMVPKRGHDLHFLLATHIDNLIPIAILGDFNTHSPQWSLNNQLATSWRRQLTDWFDHQGLTCINTPNTPTWFDTSNHAPPSVIDLALINEAVAFSSQIDNLHITEGPYPLTDHAALTLTYFPITSLHLVLPPAPRGYKIDPSKRDKWTTTFTQALSTTDQPEELEEAIRCLDAAIEATCKDTLKPCRNPHPCGAPWWNNNCT